VAKTHSPKLVLADVDGTLVTNDKVLTNRAQRAVKKLGEAGIGFALTSGRPPRGMQMFLEPLSLSLPFAAFNGGQILSPSFEILLAHELEDEVVQQVVTHLEANNVEIWYYAGSGWYVPSLDGPHVDRESRTVQFSPELIGAGELPSDPVVKIVGVSDDHQLLSRVKQDLDEACGTSISAETSQPYYLDVTHPKANKGTVVDFLADYCRVSHDEIVTIGDMANDVDMFNNSGLAIAMGNADEEVRRAAAKVTSSNEQEGFARAMEDFVLLQRA
jgi:Cof subfamily protein (haloacid dehalogenase superfamily)